MNEDTDIDELNLSDAELMELLKNHGVDRRSLMKVLGVGTVLTLGAGTATAGHDEPHLPHIDSHFGYSAPEDEDLPKKLEPDRTVGLHIDFEGPIPFHFDPMGIQIDVGDIVRFNFETPDHTVSAYHTGHGRQQRVPDDADPFTSPMINAGGFWLYRFDHPGTYDIYCSPHQFFAMVMRIVVGDPDSEEYDDEFGEPGLGARPPTASEDLEGLVAGFTDIESPEDVDWLLPASADVFATDAMSVENIVDEGPVTRSDVLEDLS